MRRSQLPRASSQHTSPQQVAKEPAEERRRIEKEKLVITVPHRVLAAILQCASAPLKKADLLTVAHYLIRNLSYNQIPAVAMLWTLQ